MNRQIYSKNVIKRIKEVCSGTQTLQLDNILEKVGSDYSSMIYSAGYEQGRMDSMTEREKVKIPRFVANWIERRQKRGNIHYSMRCI